MPLPVVSQPPDVQPTQSPTLTRTSSPTTVTVTWTSTPPGVTASPSASVLLPTPGITPSLSPTSGPTPQPSAVPSVLATATPGATAPAATATPLLTPTPSVTWYLSLEGTPDFVPASYRIHYVLCVVNDTDLPLTNVVLVDSWSPRACVYFPPDNPDQISWQLGTVERNSRVCEAFALSTFSICGGVTVTNEATMTCDQGTARVVEYTQIVGTPTATALPTFTATVTPTGTLTTTLTATPTGTLTTTLTLTPTVP